MWNIFRTCGRDDQQGKVAGGYILEHFKGIGIKSHENFNSNIYIFDDSALITSATFTEEAFETNIEAGVLLEGADAEQVKSFFTESLWDTSKAMGELKKRECYQHLDGDFACRMEAAILHGHPALLRPRRLRRGRGLVLLLVGLLQGIEYAAAGWRRDRRSPARLRLRRRLAADDRGRFTI